VAEVKRGRVEPVEFGLLLKSDESESGKVVDPFVGSVGLDDFSFTLCMVPCKYCSCCEGGGVED